MSENYDETKDLRRFGASGLLWFVNTILHPFGFALAIGYNGDGEPLRIYLFSTDDKEGIVFDDETNARGRKKFIDWYVLGEGKRGQ